uniref:DUF58 domain-containing protein n=1 Tax=Ningiella ruwaisensis TaxID=2364274 RepID=UPI00109FF185|nr:DUF58 domain-containing protein [Ningiella ruwaisensis]
MTELETQLSTLKSNGIDLDMPELLRFKSLAKMLSLAPSSRAASQMAGAERSLFKGRGMEFDEARHYQAGDDIRSIDWRVTARTGRTHTKVFREERERPVFVLVDLTSTMQFGTKLLFKSVQAAHIAALVSWAAVARGDKLGGIVFNDASDFECKPRAQTKNALHFLHSIIESQNEALRMLSQALNQNTSDTTNKQSQNRASQASLKALQRLHFIAKPGSLVHIASDCAHFDDAHFALLGDMARHCELKISLVRDPFEQTLPILSDTQSLSVTDGFSRSEILIGDAHTSQDYQEKQRKQNASFKRACAKVRTQARLVSSGLPLDLQLNAQSRGFQIGSLL